MISIKPFYMFILTISIYTKFSDTSNNNIQFINNNNNNNNEAIMKNDQNPTNSTSILIKSGELFKKKGTSCQDDSFQIEFIDTEIPIPIQMNNSFLVFISCALLVLAFVNVLTF
ncbi:hypothetical protein ACTFIR_000313 [Dictyostelium discoideum]